MSKIEVNAIEPQSGTTLTIGASGDTVALAAGATSTGFGSGLAPSPVTSSAFAPVPGMGTYKEKSKPEEESPFQFGKQLLAVGAAGSRRAMANVLSTPEFIYDAAGAPFRSIGLDVPIYDELSQGTIAKYVNDYIQGTEKTVEQIKKDAKIDPQVEKGIIDNISKGNYSKAFQSAGLGIAESLPAMFMMALTPSAGAGAGIGAQVARQTFMAAPFMAGKYQEIADDPTMSESAKIMNSIVNGYAETIFEDKFGSLALIRQAQKIMSKQGIEAAKDFTKKGFIDMGLDITVYRNITPVENPKLDEYGDLEGDVFKAYANDGFPGRAEGVENGKVYGYAETFGFPAGSYSGYNNWRNNLAKLAGYASAESVWENVTDGPFADLINFSDCEGIIGPVVAKKLLNDFLQFDEKAKTHAPNTWFYDSYKNWTKAFDHFDLVAKVQGVDFRFLSHGRSPLLRVQPIRLHRGRFQCLWPLRGRPSRS